MLLRVYSNRYLRNHTGIVVPYDYVRNGYCIYIYIYIYIYNIIYNVLAKRSQNKKNIKSIKNLENGCSGSWPILKETYDGFVSAGGIFVQFKPVN